MACLSRKKWGSNEDHCGRTRVTGFAMLRLLLQPGRFNGVAKWNTPVLPPQIGEISLQVHLTGQGGPVLVLKDCRAGPEDRLTELI